ncbi:transcriptional regulator [Aquiflexum lacus]|uniref:transcriptional regulator n=1 Tax=Aquiflexum lacus TaxID=2483805 RepID=UPI00189458FE|nr:transcriptional regulator [Aquiflexum lacus]
MKLILSLFFYLLIFPQTFSQVMFVERIEVDAKYPENNFQVMTRSGGLIAFRANPEKGFNLKSKLQYFLTDFELKSESFHEIPLKDNYDLVGYDLEGDYFYALLQKGVTATSERYMIEINLKDEKATEIQLENIYNMELKEFFVLNRNAIFMGSADLRPVVQILDIEAYNVFTVQGIYSKETHILQLRKDSELGVLDVLVSRRDKYKMKQVTLLTFDEKGSKIREVNIDRLSDNSLELVEGILTPILNYQQSLIGTYGQRRREAYQGIYLADINEFGEYDIKYYTLEDFPNFYNYLNEKQRERKLKELERNFEKGKVPSIRPVLSTREIHPTDFGFLIYSDHFSATNPRYIPRNGVYANDAYRFNPNRMYFDGMNYGSQLYPGSRYGMNSWQLEGEYRFVSAHFLYLNRNGEVIWDNTFNLNNTSTNIPGKYGEVSFDGEKLHYMYLNGIKMYLSYIRNGEVIFESQPYDIELIDENERIRDTQDYSLNLTWWYANYYILTGKQRIRFLNEENQEETREVFFITKIKVDGDLYVPEEEEG